MVEEEPQPSGDGRTHGGSRAVSRNLELLFEMHIEALNFIMDHNLQYITPKSQFANTKFQINKTQLN